MKFYIGFKTTCNHNQKKIKLLQLGYNEILFNQHGILKTKTTKISIQEMFLLSYKKLVFFNKKTEYAAKIGSIIYAIVKT